MTDSTENLPEKAGRRVFVTGGTGFLGHHLCNHLALDGHQVVALCRDPESPAARRLHPAVQRVQGDVLDLDSVASAMLGAEIVLHCAGQVSWDPEDAGSMQAINVGGTETVLEAARKAGVKRVVHASTSGTIAVGDDPDKVFTEDDERPVEFLNRWPYYRTKYYAEKLALDANGDDLEVVVVNPSLLLGPGDLNGSSTTDVRRYVEQPMPVAPAGGVSFVDARDAAAAMVMAMDKGEPGRCYLVTACNCTTRTFLSRVARVANVDAPTLSLPKNKAVSRFNLWLVEKASEFLGEDDALPDKHSLDVAQHYWYCDASRAEDELGWRARDPMATLLDTVDDLRSRGVVMASKPA